MKSFVSFSLLVLALPLAGVGQKVVDKEITFEYKRLPQLPLDKSIKNYTSKIELPFEAEDENKKAEYAKKNQEAEADYQRDLQKYEIDKKEAQALYDKQVEDYKKQSLGQKMANKALLDEGKPVQSMPSAPYKAHVPEPETRRPVDKSMLAGQVKLEGFARSEQNPVVVTAVLSGFEATEKPVVASATSMRNGAMTSTDVTRYELSYRYPMAIKVEVPGKGVVFNEIVPGTNDMKKVTNTNSVGMGTDRQQALAATEDKLIADNMKLLNEFLNDQFGYPAVNRTTIFYSVEPKKFAYDEFTQAHDAGLMAYRKLDDEPAEAVEKLNTAITQWEKAMAESNPKDSKARINEDVTTAGMLNLAEATIFANDFSKSETYLFKLESMDLSRKQKKKVEELNLLMKDQKKRYQANK